MFLVLSQPNNCFLKHRKSNENILISRESSREIVPKSFKFCFSLHDNMSESILEITDTSLTDDVLSELKDNEIVTATPAIIETTINTKRQLEDDDENERSAKKVCSSEVEGEEVSESDEKG